MLIFLNLSNYISSFLRHKMTLLSLNNETSKLHALWLTKKLFCKRKKNCNINLHKKVFFSCDHYLTYFVNVIYSLKICLNRLNTYLFNQIQIMYTHVVSIYMSCKIDSYLALMPIFEISYFAQTLFSCLIFATLLNCGK